MASITFEKATGRRTVQFYDATGKRKSIRIGTATKQTAAEVKRRVEAILSAKLAGVAIDADTARWIGSLSSVMRSRMAATGLIADTDTGLPGPAPRLREFLDDYTAKRTDVKPLTQMNYHQAVAALLKFFGADRPIDRITAGDALEYRLWLTGERGLGENTARRHCGMAKQFFAFAVLKQLIPVNPFAGMKKVSVQENRSRAFMVTREMAAAVLEACPDAEWRLIFALCRFGGLRCPSEVFALTWADVDWERSRLTVRSPKTEHHEGKESRVIPLFPELRPYLEEAYDQAAEGSTFIISRHRVDGVNLRTQFTRIIRGAGLIPWPKLFHNLRATRENELADEYPLHVACEWIGNSQKVADKHYLSVTSAHFEKAVRFPVLHDVESHRMEPQASKNESAQDLVLQGVAASCDSVRCTNVPPRGVEPLSSG